MKTTLKDLAKMIDHSLLHPTMSDEVLKRECRVALKYDVASVCIKPYAIKIAVDLLKESDVKVGTVIGFPHGNSSTKVKLYETEQALNDGAVEIDMVINVGKAIGGDFSYVKDEIDKLNRLVVSKGAILKVIFANDYLEDETIIKLCEICNECQVAFVKTSTGYDYVKQSDGTTATKGATPHHLKLMRKYANDDIEVKAAGGVRILKDILFVRSIGVTRIGATATAAILDDAKAVVESGKSLDDYLSNSSSQLGGGY